MYWQKRFDRVDPNQELEDKVIEIHGVHKDFGYRRMHAILRKQGYTVNKKKVQRIMRKFKLQVTPLQEKVENIIRIKEKSGELHQTEFIDVFTRAFHIRTLLRILQNSNITRLMIMGEWTIKKLYLDPFLDLFNGEILSYGIS